MPVTRNYCCGCSLRTGSIISGSINTFFGIYGVILGVGLWASKDKFTDKFTICFFTVIDSSDITLALILVSSIKVVFNIILIIGAARRRPELLLLWMVYSIILIFMSTIVAFIYYMNIKGIGLQFLCWLMLMGALLYTHEVVRSYRIQLQQTTDILDIMFVDSEKQNQNLRNNTHINDYESNIYPN